MPNEEIILSKEKKELFEALGVEGVVADILSRGGRDSKQAVVERSFWLKEKRKQMECSANLKFWIPQGIAIFMSVVATYTVFGGG